MELSALTYNLEVMGWGQGKKRLEAKCTADKEL
jgi:hypothetical protein